MSANDSFLGLLQCTHSGTIIYIHCAFTLINDTLLLPLCVCVLSLGLQRWKQQRSSASSSPAAAATVLFCDFCAYNMAVMELIGVLGYTFGLCGFYTGLEKVAWVGLCIGGFPWSGQMLFPMLAYLECYLAVVHPITYLRLRKSAGVRLRNVSALFIWLHCVAGQGYTPLFIRYPYLNLTVSACHMAVFLMVMTFCSLSVIHVLSRPRPGVAAGRRLQVDQSKQRAFNTILIIMGVLLLRFGGNLVCNVAAASATVNGSVFCSMIAASSWFNLPSSLVLPLLFLHRAGKLPGCKHNADSG